MQRSDMWSSCGEMAKILAAALLLEEEAEEEELMLALCLREDHHTIFKQRPDEGCYQLLIKRHLIDDETKFREYFRLSQEMFNEILNVIKYDIELEPSNRVADPISPAQKLCITLRYMATGESFRSLAFQFRISHSWIGVIIKKTVKSICQRLMDKALPVPNKQMLKDTARGFGLRWNYPNCCGAVDGKHVRIKCPANSGSLFHNFKDFFSIVLFVSVDHNYKFLTVDVGNYGKEGDAGIFPKSELGKSVINDTFPFPDPAPLPGTTLGIPHVLLGDEAFKLTTRFMRPYPKEQSGVDEEKAVYNYRHSRARRCSENAFGIMCQYFRVFFTPIALHPSDVDHLVLAACILHNLMRSANIPCPREGDDVSLPTENLLPLQPIRGRAPNPAYEVREAFKNYFCSANGAVDWQMDRVRLAQ